MLHPDELAISGFWFRDLMLADLARLLADDLGVRRLGLWPHNLGDQPPAGVRRTLRDAGIEAYGLNVPSTQARLNTGDDPAVAQKAIIDAIALAEELGIPLVQTYAGTNPGLDPLSAVRVFARELEPCVREAERRGIVLAVENNLDQRGEDPGGTNPSRRPESLLALVEHFRSRSFGIAYDPCNFYTVGVEPYPYAYDLLGPAIVSIELKDVVRFSELLHGPRAHHHLLVDSHGGPFLPVPLGEGALNVEGIVRRVARDGYRGPLVFDPFARGEALLVQCRRSLDFLRGVLAGLARQGIRIGTADR